MVVVIGKDRDLLARVAVHSPHLAGTVLRLCNDLEDAHRNGELPPAELLDALGAYVQQLGKLITAVASARQSGRDSGRGGSGGPANVVWIRHGSE